MSNGVKLRPVVQITKFVTSDKKEHATREDADAHELFLWLHAEGMFKAGESPYNSIIRIVKKYDLVEKQA